MKKTLSVRIAQRMKNKPFGHAKNRADFFNVRADVEQALEEGWLVRHIWETLYDEGEVTFGYQAFRRYVHQYIGGLKSKTLTPTSKATFTSHHKPLEIPRFTFRSNIDKKDLL